VPTFYNRTQLGERSRDTGLITGTKNLIKIWLSHPEILRTELDLEKYPNREKGKKILQGIAELISFLKLFFSSEGTYCNLTTNG
jgi:uncharacterized membrane protein